MLKKLLTILIPICILCFLSSLMLELIIGKKALYKGENKTEIQTSFNYYEGEQKRFLVSSGMEERVYKIPALKQLSFNFSRVNAVVTSYYGEDITISVRCNSEDKSAILTLSSDNDISFIEFCPKGITFDKNSDETYWLDDNYMGTPEYTAEIMIPKGKYSSLSVCQGTGSLTMSNINALDNTFSVSSGSFSFTREANNTADNISLEVRSGSAKIINADTKSYDINNDKGDVEISGLTGRGDLFNASGNTSASYLELNYAGIKNYTGNVNVFLPPETSGKFISDENSGTIYIKTDNADMSLYETVETCTIGESNTKNFITVSNLTGVVTIKNHSGSTVTDPNGDYIIT